MALCAKPPLAVLAFYLSTSCSPNYSTLNPGPWPCAWKGDRGCPGALASVTPGEDIHGVPDSWPVTLLSCQLYLLNKQTLKEI